MTRDNRADPEELATVGQLFVTGRTAPTPSCRLFFKAEEEIEGNIEAGKIGCEFVKGHNEFVT